MSAWTKINATIEVEFGYATDYMIREFFANMFDDHPFRYDFDQLSKDRGYEITGSEVNATVVAEPLRNHARVESKRFLGQRWSVTVTGHLRDRELDETVSEWQRFAWKLAWFVHHDCKNISSTYKYDRLLVFPRICYYNVDISGSGSIYHRCSIK